MKKILKTISLTTLLTTISFSLHSFDWPQNEILSDSFFSYFAQLRGGTISNSLIFSESSDVKAAENGRVIAVISEHDDGSELFNSTLGNAVILAHKDKLLTVYANLNEENLNSLHELKDVTTGTYFGNCGNSGWQKGESCLEFQVIDTQNQTYINPRILMPRIGKELELSLKNITAINTKKNISIDFPSSKPISSGVYRIYKERQPIAMFYKTSIFINGALVESTTFDTIKGKDGRLCTAGTNSYSIKDLYPEEKKQLLGEITIPKGKNLIAIVISDILGKETVVSYNIEAF